MSWFFDNPLASMYGPAFLVLFWVIVILCVVALRWRIHRMDDSRGLQPLQVPEPVDPYAVAYLRGGNAEVVRTAIVELFHRGDLTMATKQKGTKTVETGEFVMADRSTARDSESPRLQVVQRHFAAPAKPASIFASPAMQEMSSLNRATSEWIERERLVHDEDDARAVRRLVAAFAIGIVSLGLYKVFAAIDHGRMNFGFLIVSLFISIPIVLAAGIHSRLTQRGRRFLKDLQLSFASLKKLKGYESHPSSLGAVSTAGYALDPVLLSMGIFGMAALSGSSMNRVYAAYPNATSNAGGCSSVTTSGCGADGGSSCGGGGGGGGGCGGGGCGGCGGG